MSPAKKSTPKQAKNKKVEAENEEETEETEVAETPKGPVGKIKAKEIDLDHGEALAPDKVEDASDDLETAAAGDEEGEDEIALDDEELDPFNDKWEE